MASETKSGNLIERGSRFFRNIHIAIGSVAVGASLFIESAFLPVVAVFEFAHAAVLEGVRRAASRRKSAQPAPA